MYEPKPAALDTMEQYTLQDLERFLTEYEIPYTYGAMAKQKQLSI
jgi:hypothetical protein